MVNFAIGESMCRMCRGRRDAVVGLALVLLRASAKGLFDEITPAKPRVRSELVLPPPPPPPALAVAAPLRPRPTSGPIRRGWSPSTLPGCVTTS